MFLRPALASVVLIASLVTPAFAAPGSRGSAALEEAARLHAQIEDLLSNKARYDEAIALAERELSIRKTNLRPDDPLVAEALHDLAEAHAYRGDLKESEPLYREAIGIYEKKPGQEKLDLARILNDFASTLTNMRHLDEAEQLFQRALDIEKTSSSGPGKKLYAQTLNNVAGIHYYRGDFAQAVTLFQQGLVATEAAVGPDDPLVATTASNLAAVLDQLGRSAESVPLHERALAIRQKAFGPKHPLVAASLSNLGVLAAERGDYVKATELHEKALAIREEMLGPEHPDVGVSLNNLASAYEDRGERNRAKHMYERALAIFEKTYGPDHPRSIQALHNYAQLLVNMGDPSAARRLAQLAEYQKKKDPNTFDIRSMDTSLWIAQLALSIDQARDARQLAELVLEAIQKKLGPESTRGAQCWAVIAESYQIEGDYSRADEAFERAVHMAEKTYGPYHDQTARFLTKYATMLADRNVLDKALPLARRAGDIDERNMRLILGAGSESQKRAYATVTANHAHQLVSMHFVAAPKDVQAARFGLLTVLRRKGRVLDALVDGVGALRRRLAPEDTTLFDELGTLRTIVAKTVTNAAASTEKQQVIQLAEKRIEEIEVEISRRSGEFRAAETSVTVDVVQKNIPPGAALVEVFLLKPHAKRETKASRYVVYVLESTGEPRCVDLGESEPIDEAIQHLRAALRDPTRQDAFDLARAVDEKVMRPIRKQLGNARQILFSPDGALNLLPIGALVDEHGRFVAEDHSISYLVSGRDLLKMAARSAARSSDVVVANPEFGARGSSENNAGNGAVLSRAFFDELPGTGEEAAAIGRRLSNAQVMTRSAAREEAIKKLSGPRLLHIATHGFFLEMSAGPAASRGLELETEEIEKKLGRDSNPLLYSGIALARANLHPADGDDGILTALEASTLDLWGTKLVVLSACETGLGKLENGEGVTGLRRAFFTAGAESAIMSLWKVDDAATRDLMIGMYDRLSKGEGRAESLRRAQLALLEKKETRHPFYWASFVEIGDYTALDGSQPKLQFAPSQVNPGMRGCACEMAEMHEWQPSATLGMLLVAGAIGRRRNRRMTRQRAA